MKQLLLTAQNHPRLPFRDPHSTFRISHSEFETPHFAFRISNFSVPLSDRRPISACQRFSFQLLIILFSLAREAKAFFVLDSVCRPARNEPEMATPEELARENIDALLTQCGWLVVMFQ